MHIPARLAVARHITLVPGGGSRGRWMWPPMRHCCETMIQLHAPKRVCSEKCGLVQLVELVTLEDLLEDTPYGEFVPPIAKQNHVRAKLLLADR